MNRWPVVRLRAGNTTEVTLVSAGFFCLTTHYCGRTVPCAIEHCSLCELLPARGLYYLAVVCGGRLSILELGATSSAQLEQHLRLLHGGMRPGLVVKLSRRGNKSPVYSECIGMVDGAEAVSPMDLARHVMALYKFPPPQPDEDLGRYGIRLAEIVRRRNQFASEQMRQHKSRGTDIRVQ